MPLLGLVRPVHAIAVDEARRGAFEVLQIDLYDATARGPVLDTPDFYADCAACLAPGGDVAEAVAACCKAMLRGAGTGGGRGLRPALLAEGPTRSRPAGR